jgi:hypothetical protein
VILIDYQWLLELAPHFYTKMKKWEKREERLSKDNGRQQTTTQQK